METLGSRIRTLRLSHGMNQGDLAKLLGVSRISVVNWEQDTNVPKKLYEVAKIFHVTPEYLETGIQDSKSKDAPLPAALPADELTREERDVVDKYRSLTPEMRRAVDALLSMPSTKGKSSPSLTGGEAIEKDA